MVVAWIRSCEWSLVRLTGIVNGIDTDLYNPETDPLLTYHFSKSDLSGKAASKRALQERVGLPVRDDVPLFGIVSRLTRQKGFDVVVEELASTFCKRIFKSFSWVQEILVLNRPLLGLVKPTQINFLLISRLMSSWHKKLCSVGCLLDAKSL